MHDGHEGDDDVEHGVGGGVDAELRLGADHGGAQVEEGARARAGEPAGAVDGQEGDHELLELSGREGGQRDAGGGDEHAGGVAVGAEEAQLAVVAAVGLEALEALGGVVQDGGGGHERDGAVGVQARGAPAGLDVPLRRHHVVGADGLGAGVGLLGRGHGPGRGGALNGELRGIELGGGQLAVGAIGAVGNDGSGGRGSHGCEAGGHAGVWVGRVAVGDGRERLLEVGGSGHWRWEWLLGETLEEEEKRREGRKRKNGPLALDVCEGWRV